MTDDTLTDARLEEIRAEAIAARVERGTAGHNGAQHHDDPGPPEPTTPPDPTPVLADRVLSRSDLRALPDPQPLIGNVLDQGTCALLYGSWGTAKTFIALDWAASVATGRRWQGRDTAQRRVLYVAGEGAYGFKGRIDAWETGWQQAIGDEWFHILPQPVNLSRGHDVDQLSALVDFGGYGLVVLDTLARCMVGADENSAKDGGIVVDAMSRILHRTAQGRGVVLGVHHAGKDGKTLRGSSAFESGADTVYYTARDGVVITLERQKRKDGPEMDRHELQLATIEGTDSCVIESHSGRGTTSSASDLSSTYSQHFNGTGCTGVQLRDVAGMTKSTFYRARSELLECGWLVNIGTDTRPFYKRPGND